MNNLHGWMEKMAKTTTRRSFQVIGTVMLITFTFSGIKFATPPIFNDTYKRFKTRRNTQYASCLEELPKGSLEKKDQTDKCEDAHPQSTLSDTEYKIILIGSTGSGKSSAGNLLLGTNEENGFKTSSYAKSHTIEMISKSDDIKLKSKTYKVVIIDTPAISNTELSKKDAASQIEKAMTKSRPGPHALLLCVPATAITSYFTDVIESYQQYFESIIYESTIVVFTRCDQLQSKDKPELVCKQAMEQNSTLKKMKNHITLDKSSKEEDKHKQLKEIVHMINKMEHDKKPWYRRIFHSIVNIY